MNSDWKKRDTILFGNPQSWIGVNSRSFEISAAQVEQAIDFLTNIPDEFIAYLRKHPKVNAIGVAYSPYGEDYGMIINGLKYEGITTDEMRLDFIQFETVTAYNNYTRCLYCRLET